MEIVQIAAVMSDYFQAHEYLKFLKQQHKSNNVVKKKKNFNETGVSVKSAKSERTQNRIQKTKNDNMEYRETKRQEEQRKMFEQDRPQREQIYLSIYHNLTINDLNCGVSHLRRLEIRFLPLDPLLVI